MKDILLVFIQSAIFIGVSSLYLQKNVNAFSTSTLSRQCDQCRRRRRRRRNSRSWSQSTLGSAVLQVLGPETKHLSLIPPTVSFTSPLLDEGYVPTVKEYEDRTKTKTRTTQKPLLVYLPGFDGTLVAPFLQFPELSTEFEVWGMEVSMDDRSTVTDLCNSVLQFVDDKLTNGSSLGGIADANANANANADGDVNPERPLYIAGESFGGILALEVALAIEKRNKHIRSPSSSSTTTTTMNDKDDTIEINLSGLTLINPATCYDKSNLARSGPPIANGSPLLYPFNLMTIVPLFTDDYALPQLIKILQAKALPSVIDTPEREAYMGRSAFSLPSKLKFMPQSTLKWRLEEWLTKGCKAIRAREETGEIRDCIGSKPVLIVVGENDETLPSLEESKRLQTLLERRAEEEEEGRNHSDGHVHVHVVNGAGHACTSGSRVDLTALMRKTFLSLSSTGRKMMKEQAQNNGVDLGLEPRYDGASIGLSPTKYWSEGLYQKSVYKSNK